jgi:phosphoglycerol transferase MdoB-like AlkP superfamily enzyme
VPAQRDLLARLSRLNPTTVFLGTLVFFLVGLFVPGLAGAVLLLVLALALGTLAVATWRVAGQHPGVRALRLVVLLLLLAVALYKLI